MSISQTRKSILILHDVENLAQEVSDIKQDYALVDHTHPIADVLDLQSTLDSKALSTHMHEISAITGLQTALNNKANVNHSHILSDVTGLQDALDDKASATHNHDTDYAALSHIHDISDVTNLQTTLDAKALATHNHDAVYAALNHNHDAIYANISHHHNSDYAPVSHVHTISNVTGLQTALDGKTPTGHSHAITDITNLQNALDGKINTSVMGLASGVATLDASGLVPANQLPSYVDDVKEYAALINFPTTGETNKIYVTQDTNKIYRWTGSAYIEVSAQVSTADAAVKLSTPRTIALSGDVTGSVSFDGSADVSISAVVGDNTHEHMISNVTGLQTALDGKAASTHNHDSDYAGISHYLGLTRGSFLGGTQKYC